MSSTGSIFQRKARNCLTHRPGSAQVNTRAFWAGCFFHDFSAPTQHGLLVIRDVLPLGNLASSRRRFELPRPNTERANFGFGDRTPEFFSGVVTNITSTINERGLIHGIILSCFLRDLFFRSLNDWQANRAHTCQSTARRSRATALD